MTPDLFQIHRYTGIIRVCFFFLGGLLFSGSSWSQVELHVLGITQDAGLPQLGCVRSCCQLGGKSKERVPVVSLGITQADSSKAILMEATPDINSQWQRLTGLNRGTEPSFVFITHAHMGHYGGLMQLGREARNTNGVTVLGHPSLIDFLQRDQPWKQLVTLQNIQPLPLQPYEKKVIGQLTIRAIPVPHRAEVSAAYGYILEGPSKRALFVPDIDKWSNWDLSIDSLIQQVDVAYLDATFFDARELPGRNLREIPHPTVLETMDRARDWPISLRQKVYLIHFNHTNPLLQPSSQPEQLVTQFGFRIARVGDRLEL